MSVLTVVQFGCRGAYYRSRTLNQRVSRPGPRAIEFNMTGYGGDVKSVGGEKWVVPNKGD